MTELAFAKTFLTTLDNKTTKYPADHVFDPTSFELRTPYVLPKLAHPQHPFPPKSVDLVNSPAPGASKSELNTSTLNLVLKSNRNPSFTFSVPSTAPTTTISSIKDQLHIYLGGSSTISSPDKIKILLNKKPIPASKTILADLVDGTTRDLELGVMVIGGAPDPPPQASGPGSENAAVETVTGEHPAQSTRMEGVENTTPKETKESVPVQPGSDATSEVLSSKEFWSDLEGFLTQRIRSQEEAQRLRGLFERAWRSSVSTP